MIQKAPNLPLMSDRFCVHPSGPGQPDGRQRQRRPALEVRMCDGPHVNKERNSRTIRASSDMLYHVTSISRPQSAANGSGYWYAQALVLSTYVFKLAKTRRVGRPTIARFKTLIVNGRSQLLVVPNVK